MDLASDIASVDLDMSSVMGDQSINAETESEDDFDDLASNASSVFMSIQSTRSGLGAGKTLPRHGPGDGWVSLQDNDAYAFQGSP